MNTGFAFPEHIKTEKVKKRKGDGNNRVRMRGYLLSVFLVIGCSVLLLKLASLQMVKGSFYKKLSDSNRIRTKVIHAPRGIVMDRQGTPLVLNVPGFRKTFHDKTELLSREQAIDLLAKGDQSLEVDSLREYPFKDAFAHILGYIGQITKEQLQMPTYANYQLSDLIGEAGIEREYESLLRGMDGKQLVEVDAMGKLVRVLGQTDPIPGRDIALTADAKLQTQVYQAMQDVKRGVVIVSTPTGGVLSMVSKPSYDPNLFTLGATYHATNSSYTNISQILTDDKNQPMLDRAIAGLYPPGSTFKIITAAAGLQDKIIDKRFQVEDTGILRVGEFSFANWYFTEYGRKEGSVNVVKALARSNDIFFYKLAEMITVGRLSAMSRQFGLGNKLGIDLPGEEAGLVPTEDWKKKALGEGWYLGDTYHYGIGQGYLLTTPLQVNAWTQAIANGGMLYRPHLLKDAQPEILKPEFLSKDTISLIREGMVDSCSKGGVAFPLFDFQVKNPHLAIDGKNILPATVATTSAKLSEMRKISVACKTGTAQHGGEETLPHAWITLFAPAYNPQVVVTVLVEESGEGSTMAAPVAKKVLEAYFEEK